MMTNTMPSFPATAGAALLSSMGRSCLWLVKKYTAAPLTSTAVIALTIGLGMAANNALYGQVDHHPAPLFFGSPVSASVPTQAVQVSPPVTIAPPPVRSVSLTAIEPAPMVDAEPVTPSATVTAPVADDAEVSNADLANAQSKLQSMGLFDGDVDGFYGPKTAEAIRAFEMRNGMTPKGDMSRPVIDAILRADATDHASINAARSTARSTETPVSATAEAEPAAPETQDLVAGQRALQALISPQAETVAPTAEPTESFVASVAVPAESPEVASAPSVVSNPLTDSALIERIQAGLASLGFLHSRIDGVAGEETAHAIRNFEVFNNYEVTGRITPELVDLLVNAGAVI